MNRVLSTLFFKKVKTIRKNDYSSDFGLKRQGIVRQTDHDILPHNLYSTRQKSEQ